MNIKIKYCVAVAVIAIATAFCGCGAKSEVVKLEEVSTAPVETSETKVEQPEKTESTDREVKVYVCGAVRTPDVYCLDPDMRVADAVDAAGGFTENAGISYINLAAKISDGQKIYIPTVSEIEEALSEGNVSTATVNITSNTPGITSGTEQEKSDGMVDIKTVLGKNIRVPGNATEHLDNEYGNWRTPNKNWDARRGPSFRGLLDRNRCTVTYVIGQNEIEAFFETHPDLERIDGGQLEKHLLAQ